MDFESLRSHVMKSAKEAASAVQSFHTLDRMAAEDEYVHTDGLNVKRRPPRHDEDRKRPIDCGSTGRRTESTAYSGRDAIDAEGGSGKALADPTPSAVGGDNCAAASLSSSSSSDGTRSSFAAGGGGRPVPRNTIDDLGVTAQGMVPRGRPSLTAAAAFRTHVSTSAPPSRAPSRPTSRPSSRRGSGASSVASVPYLVSSSSNRSGTGASQNGGGVGRPFRGEEEGVEESSRCDPGPGPASCETPANLGLDPSSAPSSFSVGSSAASPPQWSLLDRMLSPADSLVGAGERAARIGGGNKAQKPACSAGMPPDEDDGGSRQWLERRRKEREERNMRKRGPDVAKRPYVMSIVAALMEEADRGSDASGAEAGARIVGSAASSISGGSRFGPTDVGSRENGAGETASAGIDANTRAFLEVRHDDNDIDQEADARSNGPQGMEGRSPLHFDSDENSSAGSWSGSGPDRAKAEIKDSIQDAAYKGDKMARTNSVFSGQPIRVNSVEPVEVVDKSPSNSAEDPPKKKDPNRFFDDLDRRLATPSVVALTHNDIERDGSFTGDVYIDDEEVGLSDAGIEREREPEPDVPPNFRSFAASTDKFGWLRSVAAPHLQSVARNVVERIQERRTGEAAPLTYRGGGACGEASNGGRRAPLGGRVGAAEDEYARSLSSVSVLEAEEHAELERLKHSAAFDPWTGLTSYMDKNSRLAFVAFTLVLAAFVYFYTRKRMDNDVT